MEFGIGQAENRSRKGVELEYKGWRNTVDFPILYTQVCQVGLKSIVTWRISLIESHSQ